MKRLLDKNRAWHLQHEMNSLDGIRNSLVLNNASNFSPFCYQFATNEAVFDCIWSRIDRVMWNPSLIHRPFGPPKRSECFISHKKCIRHSIQWFVLLPSNWTWYECAWIKFIHKKTQMKALATQWNRRISIFGFKTMCDDANWKKKNRKEIILIGKLRWFAMWKHENINQH